MAGSAGLGVFNDSDPDGRRSPFGRRRHRRSTTLTPWTARSG